MAPKPCLLKKEKKKSLILFFPTLPHEWSREYEILFFLRFLAKPQTLKYSLYKDALSISPPLTLYINCTIKYIYREIYKVFKSLGMMASQS